MIGIGETGAGHTRWRNIPCGCLRFDVVRDAVIVAININTVCVDVCIVVDIDTRGRLWRLDPQIESLAAGDFAGQIDGALVVGDRRPHQARSVAGCVEDVLVQISAKRRYQTIGRKILGPCSGPEVIHEVVARALILQCRIAGDASDKVDILRGGIDDAVG